MSVHRLSRVQRLIVGTTACCFVIGTTVASSADPSDVSEGFPDNNPHSFCFGNGVGDDPKPNIREAEWDALDAPTDVNVDFHSTCDLASSTETDVVWRVGNLPDNVKGKSICEDSNEFLICDQFYNTMDMAEIENVGVNDELDETFVACHELGHTVTLEHGQGKQDCMDTGIDSGPVGLQWRRYSADHHIPNHINEIF